MKKENVLTRKIKLIPVGDDAEVDRVLKYIEDGISSQSRAMNMYISSLYMMSMMEATKDDRKEANTLFNRISNSSKGSAYPMDIQFPVGLGTSAMVGHTVKADYENAIKKGLLKGKTSLPSYRRDNPLMIHNRWISPMSTDKKTSTECITPMNQMLSWKREFILIEKFRYSLSL